MEKYKIILVDDHALVRQGIKNVLETDSRFSITGEANNGEEVMKFLKPDIEVDMIILDIDMPGRDGLETLVQIKEQRPDIKVLVLSMYSEKQYALRALKAGSDGYLMKGLETDSLLLALNKIFQGKKYISNEVADLLVDVVQGGENNSLDSLSDREFQVLKMIGRGSKQKDIAEELFISPKTVNTYLKRLKEKLQLNSFADIIAYCITHEIK